MKLANRKRIFYLSFLHFNFSNVISQLEVSRHLSERGNEVYLFGIDSRKNYTQFQQNMHLIPIRLKFMPVISGLLYILTLLVVLPFYIVVKKPDYIITEKVTSIVGLIWKPLLHPLNSRVVLDIRTTPIKKESGIQNHLDALLFKFSVHIGKKLDGITILTKLMKEEICNEFNINPTYVGVWTSGVSTELFDQEKYDGEKIKEEFGLANKFIIFYHGLLAPERGIVETVKSIEILKEKYQDLVLFLLGSDPYVSLLKTMVERLGVQDIVAIHEKVDYLEVPKYIAMCDLGIVPLPNKPNWRHQCPLKLLEYLAMKKVVIATDIPANREVIGKNKCGIYIPSVDPKEIAKAVVYAHENKKNLKEWGTYGRTIIEKQYTWEKIAENLETYLLNL